MSHKVVILQAAVKKSKLIIIAVKKCVQVADDVIYNFFEIDCSVDKCLILKDK